METGLLKTVFHVHTNYSDDSDSPPEAIVASARNAGIGCVTITDHDTIAGAQAVRALAGPDLQVIIGEEVSTTEGHLIGLFLTEEIEPGLSPRRTAELIRRQGGLVVVPHPFNRLFGCSLRQHAVELAQLGLVDAVEISNAQNLLPFPNRRAAAFAREFGLPALVGVDMHHRDYLGTCFQWLPPFEGPRGFLDALTRATLVPGRHPLGYFVKSAQVVLREKTGLPLPAGYGANCPRSRAHAATAVTPAG